MRVALFLLSVVALVLGGYLAITGYFLANRAASLLTVGPLATALAQADQPFARPLINSGRLSTPTPYLHSSLNTPDEEPFAGLMKLGMAEDDDGADLNYDYTTNGRKFLSARARG